MKVCNILNKANGKKSELHQELLKVLKNQEEADLAYAKVMGSDFKEIFGDWVGNYNDNTSLKTGDTLPGGEPKLYKKEKTNQYYFILQDKTRYFIDKEGLRNEFSPSDIKDITKHLLFRYVSESKSRSLNEFEDNESNSSIISSVIDKAISSYKIEVSQIEDAEDRAIYSQRAELVERYKDEFRNELIFAIQSLGEEVREVAEEDKGGGLNITKSITVNPKTSATVNTKVFLSQILDSKRDDFPDDLDVGEYEDGRYFIEDLDGNLLKITNTKQEAIIEARKLSKTKNNAIKSNYTGYLNTESFMSLNEVWEVLQPMLSDIVTTGTGQDVRSSYSKMYAKLKKMKEIHPWMNDLMDKLDDLESRDRYKLYEFIQAFSKTKISYYVTEFNSSNKQYKVINATSTNSRESQILGKWGHRFKNEFLKGNAIMSNEDKERIRSLDAEIKSVFTEFNETILLSGNNVELISDSFTNATDSLLSILRELGVFDIMPVDINNMILMNGGVENQMKTMNGLFKGVRFMIKDAILPEGKNFIDNGDSINPFTTERALNDLAAAIAQRDIDISESSIVANDNKNYFAYSNPTYISNKIAEWIEDPTGLENMAKKSYHKNSRWIKWLLGTEIDRSPKDTKETSKLRLSKFKAGMSSSFKSRGKNDGVDNTNISFEDQLHDNIFKLLGEKAGEKSYFSTITPADKSRFIQFEGLQFFNSKIKGTAQDIKIHESTIDQFLLYFTDEYNRMKEVKRENENLPDNEKVTHYHGYGNNGMRSQLFPELDFDNIDEKYAPIRTALYSESGYPHLDDSDLGISESQEKFLREAISNSLKERVLEASIEIEKLKSLDPRLSKAYSNNMISLAGDYVVNGIISSVEYTKMFSGDPAYYKNLPDLIKRVPATYTDGLQLAISNANELRFNAAIVQGVEVSSRYLKKIEDSLGDKSIALAYAGNVNTTDAQAWITPRRWRFLKQRLGQWSPKHDKVFEKMMNGKDITDKSELKLAAQPMKGVYFEINNGVPTYLKYSQAVMIPSLVKGTPMQRLYDKMTSNPETGETYEDKDAHLEIHEVITIDGIKVGAIAPSKINKGDTTELDDKFDLNPVVLSNRGWKLQQDLPVKTMHETNLGSQIQKNILEGLKVNEEYKLGNEKVKGSILLQKIHDAISTLSNIGKDEVSERLGIIDDKITSKDDLYDVLINEFKSRGGNENIISALEKETKFDAIPQIRGRVDSILMGIFNKAITKISTEGGSYIQVSPFGLETIGIKDYTKIKVSNQVDGLFKSNPELNEVGTPQEYEEYMKSIFPESKVKDMLYHGSPSKFDKFKVNEDSSEKGVWFTGSPNKARKAGHGGNMPINRGEINLYRVVINTSNPKYEDGSGANLVQNPKKFRNDEEGGVYDSAIFEPAFTKDGKREVMSLDQVAVFDSNQVHILGDKNDIDKFIEFKEKISNENKSSGIKIVSKNYNNEALLPPRRGPDGQTLPGQAMIPHSLAMKLLKQNGYKNINEIKDSEWLELFDPKALEIISYRIPNQGMSSNDTLEIVGILPPGMGDSIIGYDGIPAKTGSDFDIDKSFVMAPNLVFNTDSGKLEVLSEENKSHSKSENTVKQIAQNNVINLYNAILQSPHTYDNMMTSIDSSFLKDDITGNPKKGVKGLFPPQPQLNMKFFSPIEMLKTKMDYMSGKMGVALTANQLVDHVANQSLDLFLSADFGIVGNKGTTLIDRPKEGVSIATSLSAFLNAYVDIAKDPYISRANHNDVTANVTFMLIRSGVDVKFLNRFIGQPILKEYVELKKRADSITGEPLIVDGKFMNPGEYLLNKYGFKKDPLQVDKLSEITMTELEKSIFGERSNNLDSVVLNSFLRFEEDALKFTNAVLAAKSDTKGGGGSPVDLMVNRNKINKVYKTGFVLNYEQKFNGTALGTYDDNASVWVQKVLNKSQLLLSGTDAYNDIFNRISVSIGKGEYMTSAKLAKKISNGIYSYLMSGTKMLKNNRKDFSKLFVNLPSEIDKIKTKGTDNFLINELEIQGKGGFDFLGINNKNKPVDYQNDIYRAWLDLYRDPSTEDLAVNLAKYAYSQSGFNPNLNQFFSYIPHEILKNEGMNSDVQGMFQRIVTEFDTENFVDQFLRHNSEDIELVPRVTVEDPYQLYGYYGTPHTPEEVKSGKEHPIFTSISLGQDVIGLYKLIGVNDAGEPMYSRESKLGYTAGKNKIFEYNFNKETSRSIVKDNNFDSNSQFNDLVNKKRATFESERIDIDGTNFKDIYESQQEYELEGSEDDVSFDEMNSTSLTLGQLKLNFEKIKKDEDIETNNCKE